MAHVATIHQRKLNFQYGNQSKLIEYLIIVYVFVVEWADGPWWCEVGLRPFFLHFPDAGIIVSPVVGCCFH